MDYEQLDIFSCLHPEETVKDGLQGNYCWDNDINEIHAMLVALAEKNGLTILKDEFRVWTHVPQYGYRLWLDMEVTKEVLKDIDFQNRIQEIAEYSKQRNIELSCMVGACFFYTGENTAGLPFSTTFMDAARRKIKKFP